MKSRFKSKQLKKHIERYWSLTLLTCAEGNQINEWSMVDTLSPLQAKKKIISFALNKKEINLCTMLKFYL